MINYLVRARPLPAILGSVVGCQHAYLLQARIIMGTCTACGTTAMPQVVGITERVVSSVAELQAFFDQCTENRATSSTKLNDRRARARPACVFVWCVCCCACFCARACVHACARVHMCGLGVFVCVCE